MRELVGHTSGMAVPKYVIDLPAAGKVPIWPQYIDEQRTGELLVTAHDGTQHRYPDR